MRRVKKRKVEEDTFTYTDLNEKSQKSIIEYLDGDAFLKLYRAFIISKKFHQLYNFGSKINLKNILEVLKLQDLKIHAFGHIHEEYGSKTIGENGPIFVNASTCTLRYKPWNKPILIEIGNEEPI
jgi:hypothetical protein